MVREVGVAGVHGPGDDFWDLLRRLGDCYVNDLQNRGGAGLFGQVSSDSTAFRRNSRDGIEGARVQNLTKPSLPKPPESSKTMPKPLRGGPDLLPAIETWKRQISSPVSGPSRERSARFNDPCFADDFMVALQRKVTFEMSEVTKNGSITSKDLEHLATRSQPVSITFEPREFWKRESANPLTASHKSHAKIFSTNAIWGTTQEGRTSWTSSVAAGWKSIMVHPVSKFRSFWSILGMMFLVFDIWMIPLRFFDLTRSWTSFSDTMNFVTLLFWNADIFISFITGYYYRGILVMKPKRIALHYLRTWFFMDLAVVTVDWVLTALAAQQEGAGASGVARLSKTLRLLRFVRLARMFRLARANALLQHLEENTFSQATLTQYGILKIIGYIILVQHVVGCLWFFVGTNSTTSNTWIHATSLHEEDVAFQYFTCLHWAFAQLGVGNVEIEAYNVPERCFCVGVALLSLLSTSGLVSTITSLMTTLEQRRNDEMNQFMRLRRFLHYNGIPGDLKDRIQRFLQYAYHSQTECTSDSDVPLLKLLSKGLHAELQFSRYEAALSKLTFLKSLMASDRQTFQENKVLQSLAVKALYTVELAQNDVVFCAGGVAESAYLVLSGSFSYVRQNKDRRVGLEHWIGDQCLWTPWLYVGELLAREIGRLVAMEAEAFCQCVGAVWEMRQQAMYFSQTVVEDLNSMSIEDLTDVKENADDLEQLMPQKSRRDSRLSSESLVSFQPMKCWPCCRRSAPVATLPQLLRSLSAVTPQSSEPSEQRKSDDGATGTQVVKLTTVLSDE